MVSHPRTLHQIINEPQHDEHCCVWDRLLQDRWEAKQLHEMSAQLAHSDTPPSRNAVREMHIAAILKKHGISNLGR